MTYQKHCSNEYRCSNTIGSCVLGNRGMILVDILVALSLASVFIIIISTSYEQAHTIFYSSRERNHIVETLKTRTEDIHVRSGSDTYIYAEIPSDEFGTTSIRVTERSYGNDHVEIDIRAYTDREFVRLTKIEPHPESNTDHIASSICSVDISTKSLVGSYERYYRDDTEHVFSDLHPNTVIHLLDIDPSLTLTDIEVRGSYAFVSVDTTRSADPDMLLFKSTAGSTFSLVSGIHTGPGALSIAVKGHVAYIAVPSRVAQIHAIDISDVYNPRTIMQYSVPLPYATATPPLGSALYVTKDRIYIGMEKWVGPEFGVVDISDPSNPTWAGGYEIGSKVNDMVVVGKVAYVAASDRSQIRMLDVADSSSITLISSLEPSGWERQEGKTLNIFEGNLRAGRTSGGFNIASDHELFSFDARSTYSLDERYIWSLDDAGGVYGIISDRFFTYGISRQSGGELFVIENISSTSPRRNAATLPDEPIALNCDGKRLFVVARDAPVIYEITLY